MHRPLIDCHVLHLPGERVDWRAWCDDSLDANRADIRIHHLEGIPGAYMKARYEGFKQGRLQFVSYVDPDDWVVGVGAFELCRQQTYLVPGAVGAWSGSRAR